MENNQEAAQLELSTWYMTIFVQTAAHHDYGVLFLWRNEEEV